MIIKANKRTILFSIIIVILIFSLLAIIQYYLKEEISQEKTINIVTESTDIAIEYFEKELSGEWESYKAKITLSDEKINIEGRGVENSQKQISINEKGTYYITGSMADASIIIEATKEDDVQLVLDNCNITSTTTSVINGIKCNTLTITLADNSENTLTDAATYTIFSDTEKTEPDGAIFTKSDLILNGTGNLMVNANYGDGIVSKDGLKIINANIEINSTDDGIRGKDYVVINNATLHIKSTGDGIKSTNTEDPNLGYIAITGGEINIEVKQDGIQAETVLNISEDSILKIKTDGIIEGKNNMTKQF